MDRERSSSESESYRNRADEGECGQEGAGERFAERLGRSNRRSFLHATAGAAAFGALGTGSAGADEDREVVNIVEDFGADPTGEEPINDALDAAIEDDTEVVFPEGEYWIDGIGYRNWDVSNLALVGEGEARLRPTQDSAPVLFVLQGTHIRIENLIIDQTAADTSTGINVQADDGLVIRDVLFDGAGDGPGGPTDEYGDNGERHGPFNIVPGVTDPDGVGLIENVHMPDGTVPYYRKGGVWVANEHAGHLQFERCSFEYFSDNALYASGAGVPGNGQNGSVGVENCFFRNNNTTAIRLGTPGSYARNCTVVIEEGELPPVPWGAVTGRAGWIWYGFDGFYEDIDVVSDDPRGMGIFAHDSHSGSLDVRNCRFEMNANGTPALQTIDTDGTVTVEDTSITGEAGTDSVVQLAGHEIAFDNVHINQTGAARDGFSLENVTGTISDSVLDVTGDQFVPSGNTDVWALNLHDEGEGPSPDPEHDYDSTEPGPKPTRPDDTGRDEHVYSEVDDGIDHDFRLSDIRLRDAVHYDPDGYVVGSATVTNHGEEPATAEVGIWLDFFEDFLAGERVSEEITLDPGESTGVVIGLDDASSSPNNEYTGLKFSTLSEEHEFDVTVLGPAAPGDGDEGCGPGFWKNADGDAWAEESVFWPGFAADGPFALATDEEGSGAGSSLAEALGGDGGPGLAGAQRILLRAATAGLLNAQDLEVDYPLTEYGVIDAVDDALETGDRDAALDLAEELDEYNGQGC